jgi:glutamate carboxypeptidase
LTFSQNQAEGQRRLHYFNERLDAMVSDIRKLVEIESPSDNKAAVDRLGAVVASKFAAIGGLVRFHPVGDVGNHLQVDFAGQQSTADVRSPLSGAEARNQKNARTAPLKRLAAQNQASPSTQYSDLSEGPKDSAKPVLLLGHYDTVYPMGTLAAMPCQMVDGKLTGPGVLDMKSGIGLMLHALAALRDWHGGLPRPVTLLLVSDEEVGSESSRAITESLAKKAAAVLVLEPAYALEGKVKTARKGVGEYQVKVTGKASHAGLDFQKGANAIVELARQIEKISRFTDLKKGLTVNVGIVNGGSRTNVVPAEAVAQVDVRIARMKDAAEIDKKMRELRPYNHKCKVEVSGGVNRPPMERAAGIVALYEIAVQIARGLGLKLGEAAVGGGSDGNFTAGLGIPTLDGLGGVGDGAHAVHEHIVISELPLRAALLAGLIELV